MVFKTLIGAIGLILGVCLILPCLPPLRLWSIRTVMGGHYRKKNSHTCNDAIKIQTPRSRWCSLTHLSSFVKCLHLTCAKTETQPGEEPLCITGSHPNLAGLWSAFQWARGCWTGECWEVRRKTITVLPEEGMWQLPASNGWPVLRDTWPGSVCHPSSWSSTDWFAQPV
jgi:hypothetical protein